RIAAIEMITHVFPALNRQEPSRQLLVDRITVQARAQSRHFIDGICNAGFTKVRKQMVVVMNSEEAGVDRTAPTVCLEERVQRGSGRLIHRASRYESSTALITS